MNKNSTQWNKENDESIRSPGDKDKNNNTTQYNDRKLSDDSKLERDQSEDKT